MARGLFRHPPHPQQRREFVQPEQPVYGAYETEVRADDPIAYYRMGEPSGSVLDSVGSAHGTTTGTVTRDVTGLITNDDDGAASFAASAYVSGTLGAALPNVFSLEAWLKVPASGTSFLTFFSTKGAASNVSMGLARSGGAGNDFTLKAYIFSGGGYRNVLLSVDSVVAAGGTYHIVWTRAGTTGAQNKVYVNGVDQSAAPPEDYAVSGADTTFYIGGFEGTDETWVETIDEVALYDTVLSPTRVLAHYDAATSAGTQNLTLALINQTAATFAPTVTTANAISVALTDQTAAAFNPTITTANAIVLALINQTGVPFDPTITTGAAPVSVGLINQAGATFTPTVTTTASISVALIDQTGVLFAPTVTSLATISVALINQAGALFSPTVTSLATISVALTDSTGATFAPTVTSTATVSLALINQAGALFDPTVTPGAAPVSVGIITQTGATFTPTVSTTASISVGLIDQTGVTFTPTVSSLATISVGLINSTGTTFSPTVTPGTAFIVLALTDQTGVTFAPTITSLATIDLNGINQTAVLFAPTAVVNQDVSPGLINQTGATFAPTVTSLATVSVALIDRTGVTFAPTITTGAVNVSLGLIDQTASVFTPRVEHTITYPIAFVQAGLGGTRGTSGTSTTDTGSKTLTVGNTIFVVASSYVNADFGTESVTDNLGNVYSLVARYRTPGDSERLSLYAAPVTVGGVQTTLTYFHDTSSFVGVTSGEYSHVGHVIAPASTQSGSGTAETWLASTSIPAGGAAIGGAMNSSNSNISAGAANGTPSTAIVEATGWGFSGNATTLLHALTNVDVTGFTGTSTSAGSADWVGVGAVYAARPIPYIAPSRIDQPGTTFTPTITTGVATVSVGLINQTAATFSPTVTTGAVSISLGLIDRTGVLFAPSTFASQEVVLGRIDATGTTFAPTITAGAVTVSPGLIDQTAVANAPSVTTSASISLALIDRTGTTFSPSVTTQSTIDIGLIDQTGVVFDPVVSVAGQQIVELDLIDSTGEAFEPEISSGVRRTGQGGSWRGYAIVERGRRREEPEPVAQMVGLRTIAVNTQVFTPTVEASDDEFILGLSEEDLLVLA